MDSQAHNVGSCDGRDKANTSVMISSRIACAIAVLPRLRQIAVVESNSSAVLRLYNFEID